MGIQVTHRVKNSNNETIGFIGNNRFINIDLIKSHIKAIENLKLLKSGQLRASKTLPIKYYRDIMREEYKRLNLESSFKRVISFGQ